MHKFIKLMVAIVISLSCTTLWAAPTNSWQGSAFIWYQNAPNGGFVIGVNHNDPTHGQQDKVCIIVGYGNADEPSFKQCGDALNFPGGAKVGQLVQFEKGLSLNEDMSEADFNQAIMTSGAYPIDPNNRKGPVRATCLPSHKNCHLSL